jgi:hypothetical protein
VTIKPELKPMPPPMFVAKKVPLKVAVIVPPASRSLQDLTRIPSTCLDSAVSFAPAQYGVMFQQTVVEVLSRMYEQVESVQGIPSGSNHDAILEASLAKIGFKSGCGASPESYVLVEGAFRLMDANGKEVWRSPLTLKRSEAGITQSMGGPNERFGANFSASVGVLVAEWVQELTRFPLKQWAKGPAGSDEGEERIVHREAGDEVLVALKSDVDEPPVVKPTRKHNAYAVAMGIEKYREKLPKADFAARDAKIMGEYLTKVLGYPEENVVVRTNDLATRNDMEKYFGQWLKNNVEKDGTVFIYYSGHGAPNPKTGDAYLVPYDGDPTYVDTTAFPLKRLYETLDKLPAKEIVVVLDSCFSGAGGRSVLAKGAKPMGLSVEQSVTSAVGKAVVLTASGGDQISSAYGEKGHGLMTYFFLKGLRGDADANEDGILTMAEVYHYLKPQVEKIARKQSNNEQVPQLLASPEQLKRGGVTLIEKSGR